MLRRSLSPMFVLTILALAGCDAATSDPAGEPAPPDSSGEVDASTGLAGTYEVEYSEPEVAASVGFLSTTPSFQRDGEDLMLTLEFEEPNAVGSSGSAMAVSVGETMEIDCFAPNACSTLGGAGRLVFVDGEAMWEPEVVLYTDEYIGVCAEELRPPKSVPLRDAVYGADGELESFTVDIAHLVNNSANTDDPDLTANGPCSVAALIELEMTATRVG